MSSSTHQESALSFRMLENIFHSVSLLFMAIWSA